MLYPRARPRAIPPLIPRGSLVYGGARMPSRRLAKAGLILACLAGSLNLVGLFDHDLWMPDEPREAEIAREFLARDCWVLPRLNGGRWLEKPPLYHWTAALAFRWTGRTDPGTARLPSALAGAGIGILAWLLARRLGPPGLGPWAAFLAWTSAELLNASHSAMVDALFSFWVTAALACLALAHAAPERPDRSGIPEILAAFFSGLAFLTKLHLGPVLIGSALLSWAALSGRWDVLRRLLTPLPLLIFLATAAPWPALLYAHERDADRFEEDVSRLLGREEPGTTMGADALGEVLWGQLLARATGGSLGHAQPAWYYLPQLFLFAAPASLLLPFAIPWAWRRRREPLEGFALAWLLGSVLVLSLSRSKRVIYLTPCVAPAALLAAAWGRAILARRGAGVRWALAGFAAALLGGILAVDALLVPKLDRELSFRPLAAELRQQAVVDGKRSIEGYALSENQQGALCFALGQRVRCFSERGPLLDALREGRKLLVMPAERYEKLASDPEAAGSMKRVGEAEAAGTRFALVMSRP